MAEVPKVDGGEAIMSQKTLFDFLSSPKSSTHNPKAYQLYEVELEVHGYLWYHTVAMPTSIGWVHQVAPIIHNYPLILGFLGRLVEDSYVNEIGVPTYKVVRKLARETGIYVYPAMTVKTLIRRVQFTGIGEGYVCIRGKTRLTYPERGFNTLLLPGTILKTYLLAKKGFSIPKYIRIGAKRVGLLKLKKVEPLKFSFDGYNEITHPANSFDTVVEGGLVLLHHGGGDIVIFGRTERSIVANRRGYEGEEKVVLAYPVNILGENIGQDNT